MNAVISLCHFCEAHGPCAIFSTQTLRDTKIEEITLDSQIPNKNCPACNSIDINTAILSKDEESNANFLSTQIPVLPEVSLLIKQASVRSLSCEVSCNKDGGFVFFGDASRGHVLSHTFHISDVQARGFYQLFSIIVLMKDKFFLLNIQPFLSDSLKKISQELQCYAQKVYVNEQSEGSVREQRMSGNQALTQTPRSLIELTGEKNIFPVIHSHFTWVLLAGARYLTEHVTFGNLPWLPTDIDRQIVNISNSNKLNLDKNEEECSKFSLRYLKDILQAEFVSACYCALVGIKIIIRGPLEECYNLAMCLQKLLPEPMHDIIKLNSPSNLTNPEFKIVSVSAEVAVPIPSASFFRIDILEPGDKISVKWPASLPAKWPDLLHKVIKAVDEPLFTDLVLEKQIKVLVEEWKNKIVCISHVRSSGDAQRLQSILGIQQHDQQLVTYWKTHLSRNL